MKSSIFLPEEKYRVDPGKLLAEHEDHGDEQWTEIAGLGEESRERWGCCLVGCYGTGGAFLAGLDLLELGFHKVLATQKLK